MGIITGIVSKYYNRIADKGDAEAVKSALPNVARNMKVAKNLDTLVAVTLLVVGILGVCGVIPGLNTFWAKNILAIGGGLLVANIAARYPEQVIRCVEKIRSWLAPLSLICKRRPYIPLAIATLVSLALTIILMDAACAYGKLPDRKIAADVCGFSSIGFSLVTGGLVLLTRVVYRRGTQPITANPASPTQIPGVGELEGDSDS